MTTKEKIGFEQLVNEPKIVRKLQQEGIVEPTEIQREAIPVLRQGRDLIGQAQTGTGKTLAFLLPILENIDISAGVQALIVTPTRELALQITDELHKLASLLDVGVLAVYGGQDVERQIRKLSQQKSRVQVVVGTPGRLLDHMRRGTLDLSELSFLVLDEADQMLDLGFLGEIETIIRHTPSTRQTAMFSATMPPTIRSLAARYMKLPQEIRVQAKNIVLRDIEQIAVQTTDRQKQDTLAGLLEEYKPFLAIAFCRTKRRAATLNEGLLRRGYLSDELHGDLSQKKREQVMARFREAKIQILVATDVAARGLDVEGVTHVFNYDIPHDVESYIHRIGRTGRAGETGVAVTLFAPRDREFLHMIEKGIHMELDKRFAEGTEQEEPRRSPNPAGQKRDTRSSRSSSTSKTTARSRNARPNQGIANKRTSRRSSTR